jgi:nucleotide-binding universal stress UspA family protein/hemerythrin-like domain-containing protein
MYAHIFVPVDESMLSAANVGSAVRLASQLGSKITFFHATPDLAATGDGALLRTMAPSEFFDAAIGDTNAVLSKAKIVALAADVPCETVHKVCDHPAEAILEAVQLHGCDLIVMASRGVRGLASWLHSSQTERVLKHSPVALLITRVAATDPITASERALAVIQDEHRSIAVVVRGMLDVVLQADEPDGNLDIRSLEAMLAYLQTFPLKKHHPKEELYIHRWLRLRAPESEKVLLELEAQHVREHALVNDVVRWLSDVKSGNSASEQALKDQIRELGETVWAHMRLEESVVLALAKESFQASDWDEIAVAFESNNDPSFGDLPSAEFSRLFTMIANSVPTSSHWSHVS